MRKFIVFSLLFAACTTASIQGARGPSGAAPEDYPRIFAAAREILKRSLLTPNDKVLKNAPESRVIDLFQRKPEIMTGSREQIAWAIEEESRTPLDVTKHVRLLPPTGQSGYSDLQFFVNHAHYAHGGKIRRTNLIQVWRTLIGFAEKQIILNVFDFDLQEVAQDLAAKGRAGLDVRVGIDAGTFFARKEVKDVVKTLTGLEQEVETLFATPDAVKNPIPTLRGPTGVKVTLVRAVGLNHQKMTAIDWESPVKARVLFSSGNLTNSCLGPDGDLKDLPERDRPKESVPNANHMLTMKSWVLANLIHHELTKTLDEGFLYRGSEFPTSGAFQVTGPGVDPMTLEAYPEHSLIISFTPGGGHKNVNGNIIAHFLKNSDGPIRLIQFAYSSQAVSDAILERAIRASQAGKNLDIETVGDTPFALRDWSQFLKMSGMKAIEVDIPQDPKKKPRADAKTTRTSYVIDPDSRWTKELPPNRLEHIRNHVHLAPWIYNNNKVKIAGKFVDVNAKIHHKILSTGHFAIVGTSFNFSEGAQSNNEQIIVFHEPDLVDRVDGMTRWLKRSSQNTVYKEALDRSNRGFKLKNGQVEKPDDTPEELSAIDSIRSVPQPPPEE
ncbi:MAG: hypothetical protein ABL958_18450 [Bdellovibrionia bacterium]